MPKFAHVYHYAPTEVNQTASMTWYVMRDLTRSNSKYPAWKMLTDNGFTIYTPMKWKIVKRGQKTVRELAPVIHDLLFVRSTRRELDPVVNRCSTLQYRFVKGGYFGQAMEVNTEEMERFIRATSSDDNTLFYQPDEVLASMIGRKVRIIGGPLNGFTGNLLSVRGMRKRRLLVELPGMLTAAVEVAPDYIELINEK